MFWGLSPSLDLYQEYLQAYKDRGKKAEENNSTKKYDESKENEDEISNTHNTNERQDNTHKGDIKNTKRNHETKENSMDRNYNKLNNDTKRNISECETFGSKDSRNKDYNKDINDSFNNNDSKNNITTNEISEKKKRGNIEDSEGINDTKNIKNNNENNENGAENQESVNNNKGDDTQQINDNNSINDIKINIGTNESHENNNCDNFASEENKDSNISSNYSHNKDNNARENHKVQSGENISKESIEDHSSNNPRSLNILLFGAGDPRHLIHTIAKTYTHCSPDDPNSGPNLNFYIVEGCIEILARSIALLGIALECPDVIALRNKVHLFMDIYGNTMMRPTSHLYLVAKAKSLLKMVTDDEQMKQIAPFLSIESLKYRERDGLENSFNFWLPKPEHVFNITHYWEVRLRSLLGQRYDHREGAFDWDLSMTLKYREGKQICSQEYRYWRETGIAFSFPEYEQCKPNKTMSAGLVRNGKNYIHRGYVGDIQTGPFCAFGLRVKDQRFSKSAHGENDYRSTDVTERNLLELFYEILERKPYVHDNEISRKLGAVKLQMGKIFTWNECDLNAMQNNDKPWQQMNDIKINYLSADEIFALQDDTNGRWHNFFDVAFVAQNYFAFIKPAFGAVLRANALLIMETKLMTMARKEELTEFELKLKNFAKSAKLENVLNYSAINGNFSILKFRKNMAEAMCENKDVVV